jgi:hypothetical protein
MGISTLEENRSFQLYQSCAVLMGSLAFSNKMSSVFCALWCHRFGLRASWFFLLLSFSLKTAWGFCLRVVGFHFEKWFCSLFSSRCCSRYFSSQNGFLSRGACQKGFVGCFLAEYNFLLLALCVRAFSVLFFHFNWVAVSFVSC